jgi:arginine exporter protein ArgO
LIVVDGVSGAALAGVIAGAAVALPLGAIGVLLVQEAIATGWRTAAAGASGVAIVDLAYATVAVLAGNSVSSRLTGHERVVQLIGAGLLTAVAVRGLLGVRKAIRETQTPGVHSPSTPPPAAPKAIPPGSGPVPPSPAVEQAPPSGVGQPGQAGAVGLVGRAGWPVLVPSPLRVAGRFVALTAVNPLTAVYFVALAAGSGDAVRGPERTSAFLTGVFGASLTWQLLLVTVGWLAGGRMGSRARVVTGLVGHLVVLGYALRMAASAG